METEPHQTAEAAPREPAAADASASAPSPLAGALRGRPRQVLELQRKAGNRATTRVMRSAAVRLQAGARRLARIGYPLGKPLPAGAPTPLKDETDLLVLKEAEARRLPLLAICFGMQVWNVYRGGSLIQDIASEVPKAHKHEQGAPRDRRSHRLRIQPESLLASLAGEDAALVNSHHHQALEQIGEGLQASAWSSDGLVEAVEDTREGRWALGVQWHPEIGWEGDRLSSNIFRAFLDATLDRILRASDNAD